MGKFCSNCGKEINENADICLNCGILIKKDMKVKTKKNVVPGKGLSIASMILGIIATLIVLSSITTVYEISSFSYYVETEAIVDLLSDIVLSLILSITGLVLSAIGFSKFKSGFNISGLILNSISVFLNIVIFIINFNLFRI